MTKRGLGAFPGPLAHASTEPCPPTLSIPRRAEIGSTGALCGKGVDHEKVQARPHERHRPE